MDNIEYLTDIEMLIQALKLSITAFCGVFIVLGFFYTLVRIIIGNEKGGNTAAM